MNKEQEGPLKKVSSFTVETCHITVVIRYVLHQSYMHTWLSIALQTNYTTVGMSCSRFLTLLVILCI